jgi:hypothetical protein
MMVLQLAERGAVRTAHLLGGPVEQLPVVIAADRGPGEADQHVGGLRGFQRTRHGIAEIEHAVGRDLLEILHHGAQRADVAVDIGEDRDAHQAACSLA